MPEDDHVKDAGKGTVTVRLRLTAQQCELLGKLKADPRFPQGAQEADVIRLVFRDWLKEHDLL